MLDTGSIEDLIAAKYNHLKTENYAAAESISRVLDDLQVSISESEAGVRWRINKCQKDSNTE